jgi:hypothetical protein
MGTVFVFVIIILDLLGTAAVIIRKEAKWKTPLVVNIKTIHGYMGWALFILSFV